MSAERQETTIGWLVTIQSVPGAPVAPVPTGDHAVVVATDGGTLTIDEQGKITSGDGPMLERFLVANDFQLLGRGALAVVRMAMQANRPSLH